MRVQSQQDLQENLVDKAKLQELHLAELFGFPDEGLQWENIPIKCCFLSLEGNNCKSEQLTQDKLIWEINTRGEL